MTGSKVLRILRKHGLAPEIPEDLYHLIKKAVSMRKHLEQFRKDRDGKFRLILVESRIHRLARYYKVSSRALSGDALHAILFPAQALDSHIPQEIKSTSVPFILAFIIVISTL